MNNSHAIDVVIPSFRLDEHILIPIIDLKKPEKYDIHIYIVADNPNATIPSKINELSKQGRIHLIINDVNLGFSATRNKGIQAGNSKWILLLDDDIVPDEKLLYAYTNVIEKNANAIGFIGVTDFPPPFNSATKALTINGSTAHFNIARQKTRMKWAPTANIMLNREKLTSPMFDKNLKKGGEDIEFLVRNSLVNNDEYISVPDAIVVHPWWNSGKMQTGRMIRYGIGAAEIANLPAIRPYTYIDFTNSSETLLLLLLLAIPASICGFLKIILIFMLAIVLSEFITNFIRTIKDTKTINFDIAWRLMAIKNTYEIGQLWGNLRMGHLNGFSRRIDMSFKKASPSWFRLNRWKIIKLLLIAIIIIAAISL